MGFLPPPLIVLMQQQQRLLTHLTVKKKKKEYNNKHSNWSVKRQNREFNLLFIASRSKRITKYLINSHFINYVFWQHNSAENTHCCLLLFYFLSQITWKESEPDQFMFKCLWIYYFFLSSTARQRDYRHPFTGCSYILVNKPSITKLGDVATRHNYKSKWLTVNYNIYFMMKCVFILALWDWQYPSQIFL